MNICKNGQVHCSKRWTFPSTSSSFDKVGSTGRDAGREEYPCSVGFRPRGRVDMGPPTTPTYHRQHRSKTPTLHYPTRPYLTLVDFLVQPLWSSSPPLLHLCISSLYLRRLFVNFCTSPPTCCPSPSSVRCTIFVLSPLDARASLPRMHRADFARTFFPLQPLTTQSWEGPMRGLYCIQASFRAESTLLRTTDSHPAISS